MGNGGKEELRGYNSMTQQKEVLHSLVDGKVSVYLCGITAYDFRHLGRARGRCRFRPPLHVLEELKQEALKVAQLEVVDIERLIEERALGRKNKEFAKSDQIRAELMAKGVALMDDDWSLCSR